MNNNCKKILKGNLLQLKEIILLLYPSGKKEWGVFTFFFFFYVSYSLLFLFSTGIVDHPHNHVDMYFSFDNAPIFHDGVSGYDAHPLMGIITYPFVFVSSLLTIFGYKWKGVFLICMLVYLVSMANIFVMRYLREIVKLKGFSVYLITLLFGFFSTNLVLVFTTESYTISLFLLSFMVYYYSRCIVRKEEVRFLSMMSFSFLAGGVTITNFSKGIIPYLFTQKNWKKVMWRIVLVGFLFAALIFVLQYVYEFNFIHKIMWRLSFTDPSKYIGEYYERAIDLFLGSPIFFPDFYTAVVNGASFGMQEASEYSRFGILIDFYHHWWQYLWVAILYAFVLFSIIRNYKSRLVLLIIALFGADLFLHLVLGYGLGEGFIYGGHWVFVVPMLFGWGVKSLDNNIGKVIAMSTLSVMFIVLVVNNLTRLSELLRYAQELYPSIG